MAEEQTAGRPPASRRRRLARWLVAATAANFLAFALFSWAVGGMALHGLIDEGRYYLADQHQFHTPVSPGLFYFSLAWGWLVIASIPILLGSYFVMRRPDHPA